MDAAASIIAVLQLTSEVVKYLKDFKDAPKDCQQCMHEASNLSSLLINLLYHINLGAAEVPWYTAVRALNIENGPIDQYKQALEQLLTKVEVEDRLKRVKRRLLWKFSKVEVANIMSRMERLKTLTGIALEMDHLKLSQAIKEDTTTIRGALPILQSSVSVIQNAQSIQLDALKLEQHEAMLQWLSPIDFAAQQHDIIFHKENGTGQWFIDSVEFKEWQRGLRKTLFCPGIPGAGKTMIAAIAIQHLQNRTRNENIGIAYLFCSYKTHLEQTSIVLLATVLKQLAQSQPDVADHVARMYNEHQKHETRPTLDELLGALKSVSLVYSTIYIVVDALDECISQDGTRTRLIVKLRELQVGSSIQLMFTSRFIPEVIEEFRSELTLKVRASDHDVRQYVASQRLRLPRCIQRDDKLMGDIQDGIVEAADGMFLLARLHVDSLLDKRTALMVRSTLQNFRKGDAALDSAYSEAIDRIEGQLAEDVLLAKRTLSWISLVRRPLTVQELCHALAIQPNVKVFDQDNIYDIDDVLSVCAGLAVVDNEKDIVRLVHYTTQEYLDRIQQQWYPLGQLDLASTCITTSSMALSCYRKSAINGNSMSQDKENAFREYARSHWTIHLHPVQEALATTAISLVRDMDSFFSEINTQAVKLCGCTFDHRQSRRGTTGIHIAAEYGLTFVLRMLLEEQWGMLRVDAKDCGGRTPLAKAALEGQEEVVRLLLDRDDVRADAKDNSGKTPLASAAWGGREQIVKVLADRDDVVVDSKNKRGMTPLCLAAYRGHTQIVQLLVCRDDVEADSKTNEGQSPFSLAVQYGHWDVVGILVDRDDVDTDSRDERGRSPLSFAAERGFKEAVQLLAERDDVEVDSRDNTGKTPLLWAAWAGQEDIVNLLVDRCDTLADSKDDDDQTPLSYAAQTGNEAIVRLLIGRNDVEADSKDVYGRTPLFHATESGQMEVVTLLMDRDDVQMDIRDNAGRTPLSAAAEDGLDEMVRLLVDRGDVDADLKDWDGRTPLSWAAGSGYDFTSDEIRQFTLSWGLDFGHTEVVRLLIDHKDVERDSKDNALRTPLSWAAWAGQFEVVRLLLSQNGIEMNSKDRWGRTPLSYAAEEGYAEVVGLLVSQDDVDANVKDNNGQTALWWAARKGHEEVVKRLLATGKVDVNSNDRYNQTPLSSAADYEHNGVVKLLESYIAC